MVLDLSYYIPQESTGEWSASAGRCISCGKRVPARKLIKRVPLLPTGQAFGNPVYGLKVCVYCSRELCDERVVLHSLAMKGWSYRQKLNLA